MSYCMVLVKKCMGCLFNAVEILYNSNQGHAIYLFCEILLVCIEGDSTAPPTKNKNVLCSISKESTTF